MTKKLKNKLQCSVSVESLYAEWHFYIQDYDEWEPAMEPIKLFKHHGKSQAYSEFKKWVDNLRRVHLPEPTYSCLALTKWGLRDYAELYDHRWRTKESYSSFNSSTTSTSQEPSSS